MYCRYYSIYSIVGIIVPAGTIRAARQASPCAASILPITSQHQDIMHEVLQRRLGGNCIVHEGCFEGVILVIANDTGGQGVVADQVCDDTPCTQHRLLKLSIHDSVLPANVQTHGVQALML